MVKDVLVPLVIRYARNFVEKDQIENTGYKNNVKLPNATIINIENPSRFIIILKSGTLRPDNVS